MSEGCYEGDAHNELLQQQFFDVINGSFTATDVAFLAMAETMQEYPPEGEIYGRSLSTIRRLGAVMLENGTLESIYSPEADQAKVEFFTSVEEGFGTDLELGGGLEVRDFDMRPIIDGKVMAKDLKTPISDMTHAGLVCAEETAKTDEHFYPQYVRSIRDHENAVTVDAMARGETGYNTRIVVSPFPEEAAEKSGNDYWRNIGYVPHLKRGFVQLYHTTSDGQLLSGSLSFDGSNKQHIIETLGLYGIEVPPDETTDNMLAYAVTGTVSLEGAALLARGIADTLADTTMLKNTNTVDVTQRYTPVMEKVFNESYVHICESLAAGKQTKGTKDLVQQLFDQSEALNARYANALLKMRLDQSFTAQDSIVLHELLVYSTIEMMRYLHVTEKQTGSQYANNQPVAETIAGLDPVAFQHLLGGFGAEGAKNNRTYSACGLAISPGSDDEEGGPQNAFGGQDAEKSGKKWMNCPHCKAKVYDDPCAKVLSCWDCKALVVNGTVVSKGNGGSKKQQETAANNDMIFKVEHKTSASVQTSIEVQKQDETKETHATNEQFAAAA